MSRTGVSGEVTNAGTGGAGAEAHARGGRFDKSHNERKSFERAECHHTPWGDEKIGCVHGSTYANEVHEGVVDEGPAREEEAAARTQCVEEEELLVRADPPVVAFRRLLLPTRGTLLDGNLDELKGWFCGRKGMR